MVKKIIGVMVTTPSTMKEKVYKTITSGVATLTHTMHGQPQIPFDVTLEFERSSNTTNPAPSSRAAVSLAKNLSPFFYQPTN
jgi:hypothetical protein